MQQQEPPAAPPVIKIEDDDDEITMIGMTFVCLCVQSKVTLGRQKSFIYLTNRSFYLDYSFAVFFNWSRLIVILHILYVSLNTQSNVVGLMISWYIIFILNQMFKLKKKYTATTQ